MKVMSELLSCVRHRYACHALLTRNAGAFHAVYKSFRWLTFMQNASHLQVTASQFRKMYRNFDEFMFIKKQLDPDDLFLNDYWRRILYD